MPKRLPPKPKKPVFDSFEALFNQLGISKDDTFRAADVEEYIEDRLSHDASVVVLDYAEDASGEYIVFSTDGTQTDAVHAPLTARDFHRHIEAMDAQIARVRAIDAIPSLDDVGNDEDGPDHVIDALASLFDAPAGDVERLLGRNWEVIDDDADGSRSTPERYLLWGEDVVVGLDDRNVYLFEAIWTADDEACAGAVLHDFEWSDPEAPDLAAFTDLVRQSSAASRMSSRFRRTTEN